MRETLLHQPESAVISLKVVAAHKTSSAGSAEDVRPGLQRFQDHNALFEKVMATISTKCYGMRCDGVNEGVLIGLCRNKRLETSRP